MHSWSREPGGHFSGPLANVVKHAHARQAWVDLRHEGGMPRFTGDSPLAVYRAFCAAILLTRGIAEVV